MKTSFTPSAAFLALPAAATGPKETIMADYRGFRVVGDTCPPQSIEHYSRGDTVLAEELRTGAKRIWRAWGPDAAGYTTVAVHRPGQAWASEEAARRAVDSKIDEVEES